MGTNRPYTNDLYIVHGTSRNQRSNQMAHGTLVRITIATLGLGVMAPTCTQGPQQGSFATGSLVIPMDNCYQRRDTSTPNQTVACTASTSRDEGVFRAYGLVYFLLKKGIPVYWAIEAQATKIAVITADISIPAPSTSGQVVVKKWDWTSKSVVTFAPAFPANTAIKYLGGPFVIAAGDAPRALSLLATDPDIAKLRNKDAIDIHEVQTDFTATQVQALSGSPPRLAILNINPSPYKKTSVDVMYQYARAAGFDWTCDPVTAKDCAGGLGQGCDATVIEKYLTNTLFTQATCPSSCGWSGSKCTCVSPEVLPGTVKFNPPGTAGLVYDVLCDGDFQSTSKLFPDTYLAKGGYKLVWAPHWESRGDPAQTDAYGVALKEQLQNLSRFVAAGGNLFAECAAIGSLETGAGLIGMADTRFQSTAGMTAYTGSPSGTLQPFAEPWNPNLQIGDFTFSVVSGFITDYSPSRATPPTSSYKGSPSTVHRLISQTVSGQPDWDVATTVQYVGPDGTRGGTVAYMGGHDYSPPWNNTAGSGGQTAGTRVVLNTLFNLGFACADPVDAAGNPVACSTGYPSTSACALGTLKCGGSGGLTCVPNVKPGDQPEVCGDGIDNDCNGQVDELPSCVPAPVCTSGTTESCYSGPAGTADKGICKSGTRTCTGGVWGACLGQVLPSPEACNGRDDDCNGSTDDGQVCPTGQSCDATYKVCLPTSCNNEGRLCPQGFACTGSTGTCQPLSCPTAPCASGSVCVSGACVDPCASVTCGQGATCSNGRCFAGPCEVSGCDAGKTCEGGICVADPCTGVTCAAGTFCRSGDCVRSCVGVTCATGETCGPDGFCTIAACEATPGGGSCQGGVCVTDLCAGVTCAAQQACHDGVCRADPCLGLTCPIGTACSLGQCIPTSGGGGGTGGSTGPTGPTGPSGSTGPTGSTGSTGPTGGTGTGGTGSGTTGGATTPDPGKSGCGSAGGADLLGLGAFALALAPRFLRRRRARTVLPFAALGIALGLSGCGASATPDAPRTPVSRAAATCGGACVDLQTDAANCGACGRACAADQVCLGGGCSATTGTPFITSISPSSVGVGTRVTLQLSGAGFVAGAVARFSGATLPPTADIPLTVASATSATLAAPLDVERATPGQVQVRVVNPGRLVSNPAPLILTTAPVVVAVTPATVPQDEAAATLTVSGRGFTADTQIGVAPAAGGARIALTTTYVSATQVTAQLDATRLALGVWNLTAALPGGAASPPVKLVISEGLPVLAALQPSCVVAGAVPIAIQGTVTGSHLYPTSGIHVSYGGDTSIPSNCVPATPLLDPTTGQCAAGLAASVDVPPGAAGTVLDVWVVNPGSPPRVSAERRQLTVKAAGGTCP
jgi:hypothetical protein